MKGAISTQIRRQARPAAWLKGGGEMAERVRAHDWAATSLGPLDSWPDSLRPIVNLMLAAPQVATLAVGPERLLLYNDAASALYGMRHPDALGRPLPTSFPDGWPSVAGLYEQVFGGDTVEVSALPLAIEGGEIFDATLSPVWDEEERVAAAYMIGFEIGSQVAAERALRESEERFRALVTAGTYSIYRMSPDWSVMYQLDSDTLADTTGPITNWPDKYILAEDRPRVFAAIEEAIRTKSLFELEHRVRLADGSVGWVLSRAVPLIDPGGEIVEWFGAGSDVTERKRAEEALHESEMLRGVALAGGGMGTWRWDLKSRQVWGDAQFLALWGFPPSEDPLPLTMFTERMSPQGAAETEAVVTKAIEQEEEFDAPIEIASGPTGGHWLRWRGRPTAGDTSVLYGVSFDITEQKRADIALRESEERQSFLLKLSDAMRPEADPIEGQRTAMRLLAEHLGADRAFYYHAERGENGWEHVVDADFHRPDMSSRVGRRSQSDFGTKLFEPLERGQSIVIEDVHELRDTGPKERANFEAAAIRSFVALPLIKDGRHVAGISVQTRDPRQWGLSEIALIDDVAQRTWAMVQRVRAESALRNSEEQLREFGQASSDVLWIRDAQQLQWQYLSPAFEQIYGMPVNEALEGENFRNWLDLVVPEDRERVEACIDRVRQGERVAFQYRIIRPDGELRWLRNTDFPMRGPNGTVERIGGVGQDVTKWKTADEALAASELRWRSLAEGIPQLVWRAVDHGIWTWASSQWTAFTGQTSEASEGCGWLETLHPDDRQSARDAWNRAKESGAFEAEYRVRHAADGLYRWFQTRALPVRDSRGALVEWLGTSTDIDQLRLLQRHQQVLLAELQHRVRNTLAVVRSIARRTAENTTSAEDMLAHFQGRLDAFSRVQAALTRSPDAKVDLASLIEDELMAYAARDGKQIRIKGADIALEPRMAERMSLAIHELTTNAVKHGALTNGHGKITIDWRKEPTKQGETLILRWAESGVQIDGERESREGFGMELLRRSLPYDVQGETEIELRPTGLRFELRMPLRKPANA